MSFSFPVSNGMEKDKTLPNDPLIEALFKAGAHFGYSKSRRHPTIAPYIFGVKNHVEIFDLEKTKTLLSKAKDFVKGLGAQGKTLLFVGGKSEAKDAVLKGATVVGMPYVAGRWIGGSFTNFANIRGRVDRMETLVKQREKGELTKYTKKERLLIDKEIEDLKRFFLGLAPMKELPAAIFVIDAKHERIAVAEARKTGIPVVGLLGSDCNFKDVTYPIVGNDSSIASITFFVDEIVKAYEEGTKEKKTQNLKQD